MSSPEKQGQFENSLMSDGKPPEKKGKKAAQDFATQVSEEDQEVAQVTQSLRKSQATNAQIKEATEAVRQKYQRKEQQETLRKVKEETAKQTKKYKDTLTSRREAIQGKTDLRSFIEKNLLKKMGSYSPDSARSLQTLEQAIENNFSVFAPVYQQLEEDSAAVEKFIANAERSRSLEVWGAADLQRSISLCESAIHSLLESKRTLDSLSTRISHTSGFNPNFRPSESSQPLDLVVIRKNLEHSGVGLEQLKKAYLADQEQAKKKADREIKRQNAAVQRENQKNSLAVKALVAQKESDPFVSPLLRSAYQRVFKSIGSQPLSESSFSSHVDRYFRFASVQYEALESVLGRFKTYPKKAKGEIDWHQSSDKNLENDQAALENALGRVHHRWLFENSKGENQNNQGNPSFSGDYKHLKAQAKSILGSYSSYRHKEDAKEFATRSVRGLGTVALGAFTAPFYLGYKGAILLGGGLVFVGKGGIKAIGMGIATGYSGSIALGSGIASAAKGSYQTGAEAVEWFKKKKDQAVESVSASLSARALKKEQKKKEKRFKKNEKERLKEQHLLGERLTQDALTFSERTSQEGSLEQEDLAVFVSRLYQQRHAREHFGLAENTDSRLSSALFLQKSGDLRARIENHNVNIRLISDASPSAPLEEQKESLTQGLGQEKKHQTLTKAHLEFARRAFLKEVYKLFLSPETETLSSAQLDTLETDAFAQYEGYVQDGENLADAHKRLKKAQDAFQAEKRRKPAPASLEENEFRKLYLAALRERIHRFWAYLAGSHSVLYQDDLVELSRQDATNQVEALQLKRKEKETRRLERFWTRQQRIQDQSEKNLETIQASAQYALEKYKRGMPAKIDLFFNENSHIEQPAANFPAFLGATEALEKGKWSPEKCWDVTEEELELLKTVEADEDYPAFILSRRRLKGEAGGIKAAKKSSDAENSHPSGGEDQALVEMDSFQSKEKFLKHYVCLPHFPSMQVDPHEECWVCQKDVQCQYRFLSDYLPALPPEMDQEVRVPTDLKDPKDPSGPRGHKLSRCGHLIHKECLMGHQANRGNQMYSCVKCRVELPYQELDSKRWEEKYGFSWDSLSRNF